MDIGAQLKDLSEVVDHLKNRAMDGSCRICCYCKLCDDEQPIKRGLMVGYCSIQSSIWFTQEELEVCAYPWACDHGEIHEETDDLRRGRFSCCIAFRPLSEGVTPEAQRDFIKKLSRALAISRAVRDAENGILEDLLSELKRASHYTS